MSFFRSKIPNTTLVFPISITNSSDCFRSGFISAYAGCFVHVRRVFYFSKMGHISDQDPPLVSISHSDQQRPILLKILRPAFKLLAGGLTRTRLPKVWQCCLTA